MNRNWIVLEQYPEPVGGVWRHYYPSQIAAEHAKQEMQEAHPHRLYEIRVDMS